MCKNDPKQNKSISKTLKNIYILRICASVGRMAHVWTVSSITIKKQRLALQKQETNKQTKPINYCLIEIKIKKTI